MEAKALFASLAGFLLKHSRVTQVTPLSSYLVRFDVAGDELRDVRWTPGDKAQILIPGQAVRTYTPFGWHDDSVSFLGFIHGHTPVTEPETGAQRIGIDTGAFTTGRLTVLRLSDAGLHLIG